MSDKYISGKITFIHHEKNRAVIEYEDHGKIKTIQGDIAEKAQQRLIEQKVIKKTHRFLVGDQVTFLVRKTGPHGKIFYADNIRFQYNNALEILVNKAQTENRFLGYIKITDEKYFIKEIDSYLFFPLKISAYEIPPSVREVEKPVAFKLETIENPDKIKAVLYNHNYIPEFLTAIQHFKKQTVIESTISRITTFGIYLDLINGKIEAKLPLNPALSIQIENGILKPGVILPVIIRHITDERIVVEPTSPRNDD